MTPKQFRAAIDKLGLSQQAAGRLFKAGERTPRRWATGEASVPLSVVILLRLMVAGKITIKDIEAAND